jgi:hypothetical protein
VKAFLASPKSGQKGQRPELRIETEGPIKHIDVKLAFVTVKKHYERLVNWMENNPREDLDIEGQKITDLHNYSLVNTWYKTGKSMAKLEDDILKAHSFKILLQVNTWFYSFYHRKKDLKSLKKFEKKLIIIKLGIIYKLLEGREVVRKKV